MGDGFATVDKRDLKTTGMSESPNPTMTADYRLRHVSTLQDILYGTGYAVVIYNDDA